MKKRIKYEVCKIQDKRFDTGEEGVLPRDKTITVTFFYEDGTQEDKEYGYVTPEEVYEQINKSEDINLNRCYIKDFSSQEYVIKYDKKCILKHFSVNGSFLDCETKVVFRGTQFGEGKVDFSEAQFGEGDVSFSTARFGNGEVYFSDAQFGEGNVDFSDARFGEGDVSFFGAQFGEGYVAFMNAQFGEGDVEFSVAQFGDGGVHFSDTQFGEGKVDFSEAQFGKGKVDFSEAQFGKGDVSFTDARFGDGNVSFSNARFGKGYVAFGDARFGDGNVNLKDARFGDGNVSFYNARFGKGDVSFSNARFGDGDVSFFNAVLDTIYFEKNDFKNRFNLLFTSCNSIVFCDVSIYDVISISDIRNCITFSNVHIFGIMEIDWDENKFGVLINNQGDTTHKEKAYQFRMLKENYRNLGWYDQEDKAYVAYRKAELKSEKVSIKIKAENILHYITNEYKKNISKFPLRYVEYFFSHLLSFKIISDLKNLSVSLFKFPLFLKYLFKRIFFQGAGSFGTNPLRVAFSMFLTWFIFTLIYSTSPSKIILSTKNLTELQGFAKSAYFSAITFLTIGYGDYAPQGIFNFLCSVEGFLGLFLMAYFTVAFVRKVLR